MSYEQDKHKLNFWRNYFGVSAVLLMLISNACIYYFYGSNNIAVGFLLFGTSLFCAIKMIYYDLVIRMKGFDKE
jgi:hypothetical protein